MSGEVEPGANFSGCVNQTTGSGRQDGVTVTDEPRRKGVAWELTDDRLRGRSPSRRLPEVVSFSAVFRAEYRGLVSIAWGLTGSRETAEDIAQEALLSLHRRLERGELIDNPVAYVRRTCSNLAVSWIRRRMAETRALLRSGTPQGSDSAIDAENEAFWSRGQATAASPGPGGCVVLRVRPQRRRRCRHVADVAGHRQDPPLPRTADSRRTTRPRPDEGVTPDVSRHRRPTRHRCSPIGRRPSSTSTGPWTKHCHNRRRNRVAGPSLVARRSGPGAGRGLAGSRRRHRRAVRASARLSRGQRMIVGEGLSGPAELMRPGRLGHDARGPTVVLDAAGRIGAQLSSPWSDSRYESTNHLTTTEAPSTRILVVWLLKHPAIQSADEGHRPVRTQRGFVPGLATRSTCRWQGAGPIKARCRSSRLPVSVRRTALDHSSRCPCSDSRR